MAIGNDLMRASSDNNHNHHAMFSTMHDRAATAADSIAHTHPVLAWLDEFAAAVRNKDFEHGREMFAPEAIGFGTVAERAVGLDTLIENQWRRVWSYTHDFYFDLETVEHGGEDPVYWAAARWSSVGKGPDGRDVPRRGRSTIVLHRRGDRLLAVHSHYSFVPSGAVTPLLPPARHMQ